MVVPFQAVMFPTAKVADRLGLANPAGMVVLYLGCGAGLSLNPSSPLWRAASLAADLVLVNLVLVASTLLVIPAPAAWAGTCRAARVR